MLIERKLKLCSQIQEILLIFKLEKHCFGESECNGLHCIFNLWQYTCIVKLHFISQTLVSPKGMPDVFKPTVAELKGDSRQGRQYSSYL
jgi:hypothetical protein